MTLFRNAYKTKCFLLLFTVMLFCSFKTPKHVKLSDKIFFSYNKELCKKNRLILQMEGGAMMGDIQRVDSSYLCYEKLSISEARKLYVEVVEGYLSQYNQNETIRPYLHNYPFTIDNLDVMISFKNKKDGSRVDKDFVALMSNPKNQMIFYRAYDHETEKFIDLFREPYETAREIVLRERNQ